MLKWALALAVALSSLALITTGNGDEVPPASNIMLTSYENNNIKVFSDISPSVVYVTNTQVVRRRFSFNAMEVPSGSGTGFVWDDSGLIVTNYHVIYRAHKVLITLHNSETYEAEVVGLAPEKDIALLRIDAPSKDLKPIPLGNSSELAVGRKVLAIGNPFELDTTLTVGVVSALGREIKSLNNRTIKNVIQTDAAINPGNSGGPLLDSMGQLIGVNTSIISPSGANAGIGFAIPVNTVKLIVPQLLDHGRVYRPILGVEILPEYLAPRLGIKVNGVVIQDVQRGSPADRAGIVGLQEDRRHNIYLGDVIIAIDDEPVVNEDTLLSLLENYQPGDKVKVTTMRNEEIENYTVKLAEPPN
ncbi:MAG TPA: 2-alkenal reductase [Gammaproteobacteria bacterium]|nr:2-alkenal reductase [Gammaproteobacteria bacterium]